MEEKNYDENVEETTTENSPEDESTVEEETTDEQTQEESNQPTDEDTDDDSSDDSDDVDWRERALKAERAIEKAKKKQKRAPKDEAGDPDRLDRLELKYAGVKEPDDQDFVLEYAKLKDISVDEAINSRVVQSELKENEKARMSRNASPRNNNRAPGQSDEVGQWVKKFKKDGSLPENNPALTSKILDKLSKGA